MGVVMVAYESNCDSPFPRVFRAWDLVLERNLASGRFPWGSAPFACYPVPGFGRVVADLAALRVK
jgi:hypothetical protein